MKSKVDVQARDATLAEWAGRENLVAQQSDSRHRRMTVIWQVNIAPAMPNPEAANWTIPPDVTPGQVDAVADACHTTPLQIYAPSHDDWRLWQLMGRLEAEYGLTLDDYDVFISAEPGVLADRWIRLPRPS